MLISTAGLGVLYIAAGKLALLLAVPPGYATPIWPAAGIALAGLLLLGYRTWPGVFAGSFLINIFTTLSATGNDPVLPAILLASVIATGATLQALLGAWLTRRFAKFPVSFAELSQLWRVMALGGPLSCLTSASIGVIFLWLAGLLPAEQGLVNWASLWWGDTIGVIIIIPLVAAWSPELQRTQWPRRLGVLIPMCLATALVILLFLQVRSSEERRSQLLFAQRTEPMIEALKVALSTHLDALHSVRSFFRASRQVEREEFNIYTHYLLSLHPGIKALEWVPRVPQEKRNQYVLEARQTGFSLFDIIERAPSEEMIPAGPRPEYYPVYYIEPYAGNESALGFDLGSNPVRRTALDQARDSGEPVASASIHLVQDHSNQAAIIVSMPHYGSGPLPTTLAERRQRLRGFAIGVFQLDDVIESALERFDRRYLNYRLLDTSAPIGEQFLFSSTVGRTGANANKDWTVPSGFINTDIFTFAGRQWRFECAPKQAYLADLTSWEAQALLTGGLLFTSLFGVLLLTSAGRATLVEQQVVERTAELSVTNDLLQEREGRLMAIHDTAVDGIITINRKGIVHSFNPAAERMFGYAAHEVVGQNIKLLQPEPYRTHHDEYLQNYQKTGQAKIIGIGREVVGRRKDGTTFPLDLSVSEVNLGERSFFTGLVRDITERKATELALQEANLRLQEIDHLKSMFIASMSHELRTPLNSIIGFTSITLNEWTGPLNDEQRENLATVLRTGKHLLSLISDVIDVSKIEAGQLDVHPESFDLHEVIDEAVTTMEKEIRDKGLTLTVNNLHLTLRTDRLRLLQCLLNLLSNATKYTESGTIELSVKTVDDQGAEICVADTGIGIPVADQGKLLQPFIRLESTLTQKVVGTGLGLYLTSKLAREVLGGKVTFTSQEGEGSRFFLSLPVIKEQ